MSEEINRSEEEESFLGKPYTQHYDEDGKKDGWSEGEESFFGKKYTQHHDEDGDKVGKSEIEETFWGDKYIQNYDDDGNKNGYSEKKTTFLGSEYTQHYDQDGNEIGQTEDKETFLGKKYQEHKMKKDRSSSKKSNDDGLWGWIKAIFGLAIILAGLYLIVLTIVTIPLWGGMILISSGTTYFFAEALKKDTDWALSVYKDYKSKSIWFGPCIAAGCAIIAFIIMLSAGVNFTGIDLIILLIFSTIAFWLSKRASLSIMRWRMESAKNRDKAV